MEQPLKIEFQGIPIILKDVIEPIVKTDIQPGII